MLRALAVQALLSIAAAAPLLACPIEKIAHATREPLDRFKKIEVEARKWRSLEGGHWLIYLRQDGVPHSIVRIDYGETGQWQVRVSFVDKQTFGIVVTTLRYDAPIDPSRQARVVESVSTEAFFCDKSNLVYVQANPHDELSALAAIREAKAQKAMLFEAEEIAQYLKHFR
jgi:hypothetical protein